MFVIIFHTKPLKTVDILVFRKKISKNEFDFCFGISTCFIRIQWSGSKMFVLCFLFLYFALNCIFSKTNTLYE